MSHHNSPRKSPPRETDHLNWDGKHEIGRGRFGVVYKVPLVTADGGETHRVVKGPLGSGNGDIQKEQAIMARVGTHANIMRYYGHKDRVIGSSPRPTIELEFIDGDTLANYVSRNPNMPSAAAKSIIGQVVRGLVHLHGKKIIHRDLKLNNILIEGDGVVKIIDLGDGYYVGSGGWVQERTGTPNFLAPEVFSDGIMGPSTDMWALGVCLFQLFFNLRTPFMPVSGAAMEQQARTQLGSKAKDDDVHRKKVELIRAHFSRLNLPQGWKESHPDEYDFLTGLLEPDYTKRLTAGAAAGHRWLR